MRMLLALDRADELFPPLSTLFAKLLASLYVRLFIWSYNSILGKNVKKLFPKLVLLIKSLTFPPNCTKTRLVTSCWKIC